LIDLAHEAVEHSSTNLMFSVVGVAAAGVCGAWYLVRASRLRRRGLRWPLSRDAAFLGGCGVLAAGAAVGAPETPFTGHMAQHVLVGMVAPLLMVLGRPVTLLLRTLPVGVRRTEVLRILHSRVARVVVNPPVAALLSVGGMWALYRTPVFEASHDSPWLHAVVHLHMFVAGTLFTAAVCQLDPVIRRYTVTLRAVTLVAASAAHAVLAKSLSAWAPPGTAVAGADLQMGAQLMYYVGDVVEIGTAIVLALSWYAAGGRALAHEQRRSRVAAEGPR